MEAVPSHWPPPRPEPEPRVYPLFLLPQVLVPYGLLELVIFEPRYLQMMEDVLDGPGRIVMGAPATEGSLAGSPPFHPVAGLGEIGRHDRLPDGRYRLLLFGLRRVIAEEVRSDRLYRRVRTAAAREIPVPREREERLRRELVTAIEERRLDETDSQPIPAEAPTSLLADLLMLRMPLSHDVRMNLFVELDTEKRARAALVHHGLLQRGESETGG